MYFKKMEEEKIIESLTSVLPRGFEIISQFPLLVLCKKSDNGNFQEIVLADLENRKINNLFGAIHIHQIESLVKPNYKPYKDGGTIRIGKHYKLFNKYPARTRILEQLPIMLENPKNLEKAGDLIKTFIYEDAFPFFEYWQDIRDFIPFLENDDMIYVAWDVFSGEAMYQKMTVMWLCNHPRYEDFKEASLNSIQSRLEKDPENNNLKKALNNTFRFLKRLEKTKPLYEWDESFLEKKPFKII